MTDYGPLIELLDRFDVDLSDINQRLAIRTCMVWFSDADSRTELVARFRLLASYIDRVSNIDHAATAALRSEQ